MSQVEVFAPDSFQLALHQMGRGDILLAQDAVPQGEWVSARFTLKNVAVPGVKYYDAVTLYDSSGRYLELIALEKRREIAASDNACVRVRLGT